MASIPDVSFLGQNPGFAVPNLGKTYPGLGKVPNIFGANPGQLLTGDAVQIDDNDPLPSLNPAKLEKLAVQGDTLGYNASDADFKKRFPYLAKGRDLAIESAKTNIMGQTDPFVASALKSAGLGSLNFGKNEFAQARNMGQPIAAKEQRDRNYFTRLLADNPARSFGLNSGDISKIALANTNGINMQALGLAQGNAAQAISDAQASAANNAALMSAIGQLGATSIGAFTQSKLSPTFSPNYYAAPVPAGAYPGTSFGYGDPYSGNYYNASGQYMGNSFLNNASAVAGTGG